MKINERVSPERLAHIRASYEASRKGYAFIGHPSYNESIAIIDELQQYRAAAEPVYQYQAFTFVENSDGEQEKFWFWSDCDERFYTACKGTKRVLYAAPQVTSAPVVPQLIHSQGCSTVYADYYAIGWNACRAAMLAAPSVQAEQLSGNTEQVSQPYTLTFDQWLSQQTGKIDVDCGCVTTEAFFHWLRVAYEAGNSPAIPDGWIPVSERMPGSRHAVLVGRWLGSEWASKWATYVPGHPDAQDSGWLIPGASWTPTHWHELPAEPKQEAE